MVVAHSLPFCGWLCSSQTEANQFTGMVYQGLLLSERKRLRTESIEEHITPNSAPAQWPGNKAPAILFFFFCCNTLKNSFNEIEAKSDHIPESSQSA